MNNKTIIIGATSGIGKGLAELLAENNYKVGVTGRRTDKLEELKKQDPDTFSIKTFDATQTSDSIEKLEELTAELGGLDMLRISSGTGELNESLNFDLEKKVIDLNVTGFTNSIDWAYRYFEKQGHGQIVAITSVGGLRGSRQAPSYNATKSYQMNYLEGLRQKSAKAKNNIFITDIRPGLVATDMAKGEGLFWVMPVEKVVNQMYKAIRKRKKVVYVTKRWGFIAKLLKVLPRFMYDKM